MRKFIYLFLVLISVLAIGIVSCAENERNLSQTGLYDQSGNLITDTIIETNIVWVTNNINVWIGKGGVHRVTTNLYGSVKVEYTTNVRSPNLPEKPSDLYRVHVPFAGSGDGYYTVNYKDMNRLNELWLAQIQRKGANDGKVFAIRNRGNNRNVNNFQNPHNGRLDYYYFDDNGDIYYKGGDRNDKTAQHLMKKFEGAIIVDYRKVTRRWNQSSIFADDVIIHTGEWTVGAIYRNNFDIHTAREKFAEDKGDATDGVYDFIAARRFLYTYHDGVAVWEGSLFERQYYSKGFIEVLVLNPHTRVWDKDGENNDSTLGVDSYYAYYGFGSGTAEEHGMPGFQEWNMPYMISPRIYLAQRPEYTVPLLSHTTTFTDDSRHWCFLAIPGHKY